MKLLDIALLILHKSYSYFFTKISRRYFPLHGHTTMLHSHHGLQVKEEVP